ncbi:uncharacterized protein TNCV_2617151 [Trichonephila clavipes]|nr:uncharacterized protein TNCV_2617151 [Trichonephila clavipes]
MRCIGQGLESLKTFCAVMSLPNPVEQKSYDVNNKLSRVMKEVAEESMKRAAVEENSSSPDNLLTVSGDGTWKTRGHSSLIGVCTVIGAETGDGDTKTFNALSENKPYGDDHLIQKIECVGHVQKRMGTRLRKLKLVYSKKKLSDGKTISGKGRLTDSLIDKLAHYYGNAIRCNSTSVKEMRKAIWAVWGHSCSTDDEPMHWFCPTNPNTWWFSPRRAHTLGNKPKKRQARPVFADLSHPALLKKCLGEKFGLKINRNVCVSPAERDNRRIFTSRQRRLESPFEARRAKKIKKSKEIELFQEQEGMKTDLLSILSKVSNPQAEKNRSGRPSLFTVSRDRNPGLSSSYPRNGDNSQIGETSLFSTADCAKSTDYSSKDNPRILLADFGG